MLSKQNLIEFYYAHDATFENYFEINRNKYIIQEIASYFRNY